MNEEEAKTKWCPFARVPWYGSQDDTATSAVNRYNASVAKDCSCLGSDCAAWDAWETSEDLQQVEKPDGDGWFEVHAGYWRRYVSSGRGECGLKSKQLECRSI